MRNLIILLILLDVALHAETIASKDVGFFAVFPEGKGWSKVEEKNPGAGIRIWMQKQESTSSLFLLRSTYPLKGSKEEQNQGYRKGIQEKCDELISSEEVQVASWPAYRVVGMKKMNDKKYYMTSIVATKGGIVYTITRVCEATVPENDQDFIAFMNSVKLEN